MSELNGNGKRRRNQGLTLKQQRFVQEYLVDLDAAAAYRRAGYQVANDNVAGSAGRRMLQVVAVLEAIDAAQVEQMERLQITSDWVVDRWKRIYLEAVKDRDHSTALKALDSIAKHLGLFATHNGQKKPTYTVEDIDRLKAELTAAGFNFEWVNYAGSN